MHRSTISWIAAAALTVALTAPSAAGAQEAAGANALERGATSVMVGVSPDPTLGFWTMLSGRTALGLVGTAQRSGSLIGEVEVYRHTQLLLSPQVKRYWSHDGDVLPYLHGGVYASLLEFKDSGDTRNDIDAFGGSLAVGLDWFPVSRISVGGQAGMALNRTGATTRSQDAVSRSTTWSLETFTAALQVHFYL